ncbi:hypothetical protein BGZ93_004727 [Podila epicladia]|nr:hypothetical protein BGZ93_004727 [Podila epicladia]
MPIPRKTYSICRRYEDIVGFAEQLEEEFPWLRTSQVSGHPPSSCLRDKSVSPPWLVLKARSPSPVCNNELECTQRKESLNRYLTELFSYSPVVTQSRLVAEFFGIWKTDLEFRLNHRDDDPLALHSLFTLPFQTASLQSSTAPVALLSPVLSDTSMDVDSKLFEPVSPGQMSSSVGIIFPSPPSSPCMSAASSRKGSLWCPTETTPFSLSTEALSHKSSFLKLPSSSGSFHDSDDSDDNEDNESRRGDESDYSDTDSEYDSEPDEFSPHGSFGSESVYERVESVEDFKSLINPAAAMLGKLCKVASLENLGDRSPTPSPPRASAPRRERIVVVFPEEHRKPVDDFEKNVRNSTSADSSNAPYQFSSQLAFVEGHRLIPNVPKFVPVPITKHSKHSSLTLSDRPLQTGTKQSHKHTYQDSYHAQTGKTLSVSSIQTLGPSSSLPVPPQSWRSRANCPRSEKRGSLYRFLKSSGKVSVLNIATKASVRMATLVPYKRSPVSSVSVSGSNHHSQSPTYDDADDAVQQWTSLIKITSKPTGERLSDISATMHESSSAPSHSSSRPSSPFSRYNSMSTPSSTTIAFVRLSSESATESPILSMATVPASLLAGSFSFTFKILLDEETILALQVIEDDPNFVLSVPDLRLRVAKKLARSQADVSEAFELVWSTWSGEQVVLKNDGELKRAMQAAQGSRTASSEPSRLPEILMGLGFFLTPWVRAKDRTEFRYEFRTRALAIAIRVNRAWRNTLTPFLWMVFDDTEMNCFNIPQATLNVNSRYFRSLKIGNPTTISWVIASTNADHAAFSAHLLSALTVPLENLQNLSIEQLQACNTHYFPWLLTGLPSLKHLTIRNCSGIERCDTAGFDEPFPNLTVLRLGCKWCTNPGLAQLVRFCPNLERLFLNPSADCPCQVPYEAFQVDVMMTSGEYAELIGATKELRHLEMPIVDLDMEIFQALMEHSATLETLDLDEGESSQETENGEEEDDNEEVDHEVEVEEESASELYALENAKEDYSSNDPDNYSDGYFDNNMIEEKLDSEVSNSLCDALAQGFAPPEDSEMQ